MTGMIGRPLQAEAFELAMREIERISPDAARDKYVADAVMEAVLDLAGVGESYAEALARHGAKRGLAVYQARKVGA